MNFMCTKSRAHPKGYIHSHHLFMEGGGGVKWVKSASSLTREWDKNVLTSLPYLMSYGYPTEVEKDPPPYSLLGPV